MYQPSIGICIHSYENLNRFVLDLIEQLQPLGLNSVELLADFDHPEHKNRLLWFVKECHYADIHCSFHVPTWGYYNVVGYEDEENIAKKIRERYCQVLENINEIAASTENEKISLILHGASGKSSKEQLLKDTSQFLMWLISCIDENRNPFEVFLESLSIRSGLHRVGDSKTDFIKIAKKVDSNRFGFCWDLGHDLENFVLTGSLESMSSSLFKILRHIHFHDLAPSQDIGHFPLNGNRQILFKMILEALEHGFCGKIIIENYLGMGPNQESPYYILGDQIQALRTLLEHEE